ncbi:hypothetical protein [Thiosulfatihalobacter marinus]|jgi:hypothetical protein|uniref:hypothetical protein n=1 Tax=Thiosulfatihalobacter marinus TaxID=2792481 RepID=UPI0018D7096A|nr:hypothetical protein [Thiosulfatihalobacter marinus]
MTSPKTLRNVTPRRWTLAGTVAATALAAAHPVVVGAVSVASTLPGSAAHASEGGEAGESGEAGVELSEGPSAFLTQLGYFEGTYRIIAQLYLDGERDLARAHMEESHHAFYEDIEAALAGYDAPGFRAEDAAFVAAVRDGAEDAELRAAFEALLTALARNAAAPGASLRDRLMSIKDMVALAAADYAGGVAGDGAVDIAIEYRDSWGFYNVARARAQALADAGEQAGRDVLEQLDGLEALYPGLASDTAATDASQLSVATGWIEIIALRQGV